LGIIHSSAQFDLGDIIMATKTLVITGGSRGIGKAIALLYLKNKWRVINLSRSLLNVKGVKNIFVDFSSRDWEESVRGELSKLITGRTTISLVHNAGTLLLDTTFTTTLYNLDKTFNVNVFSAIILNQIILEKMDQGSSIIYIGSTLSEIAVPNMASYIMSKHAQAGLMKSTCQDLNSNPNIHTCMICPGPTDTDMIRENY
jgi:NAD(P)-dependent dehydrogenase (short-subunit alcohol dehydrogenase family)